MLAKAKADRGAPLAARSGKVTIEHETTGEKRELDATTLTTGNVQVHWPMWGMFLFSGKTGKCLDREMRSWRLADVRAIP